MREIPISYDLFQHLLGVLMRAHGTLERQMNGTANDTFEVWQMTSDAYDRLVALQPASPQTERQGPFIPTLQDLHDIFSEEEAKSEALFSRGQQVKPE